jgi:sterol desaturase/sphingolipid hydroxylase (fatty acid hydroxylase superfamily)
MMSQADSILNYAAGVVQALAALFAGAGSFLSPVPLLVAALIAGLVVAVRLRRSGETVGVKRVLGELFPRFVWMHRSVRHDIFIILINDGLLFFLPAMVAIAIAPLGPVAQGLGESAIQPSFWKMALFGIYFALVWDFFATFAHYLKHKIPVLWEFHKVHHCAEVLTPFTAMRRHPVEIVISALITGVGISLALMVWSAVIGMPETTHQVGGVVLAVYLWRLLGYNIRHTHIWISYGPFWNRLLVSPAHHQLHHSREQRHYDCNFGHIFTFWDRLFGTLYQPVEGEAFEFGIECEENAELNTLAALYIRPIQKAAERFAPKKTPAPASMAE